MSKVESIMKKLFGICVLILMVGHVMAQDVIYPTVGSHVLSREGNKFYCDGEKISRRDVQAYIKFNADQDIYKQFRSGKQMYDAGWSLMGIGLGLDAAAVGLITAVYIDRQLHSHEGECGCGVGLAFLFSGAMVVGGLVFEVPAIPLICVGKSKMRKSFDAYNISLPQAGFQPELRLQTNNNGIGLVCAF